MLDAPPNVVTPTRVFDRARSPPAGVAPSEPEKLCSTLSVQEPPLTGGVSLNATPLPDVPPCAVTPMSAPDESSSNAPCGMEPSLPPVKVKIRVGADAAEAGSAKRSARKLRSRKRCPLEVPLLKNCFRMLSPRMTMTAQPEHRNCGGWQGNSCQWVVIVLQKSGSVLIPLYAFVMRP